MTKRLKNPKSGKVELATVFMNGGEPVGILFPDGTEILNRTNIYKMLEKG